MKMLAINIWIMSLIYVMPWQKSQVYIDTCIFVLCVCVYMYESTNCYDMDCIEFLKI